jgi:hypothetical protein
MAAMQRGEMIAKQKSEEEPHRHAREEGRFRSRHGKFFLFCSVLFTGLVLPAMLGYGQEKNKNDKLLTFQQFVNGEIAMAR